MRRLSGAGGAHVANRDERPTLADQFDGRVQDGKLLDASVIERHDRGRAETGQSAGGLRRCAADRRCAWLCERIEKFRAVRPVDLHLAPAPGPGPRHELIEKDAPGGFPLQRRRHRVKVDQLVDAGRKAGQEALGHAREVGNRRGERVKRVSPERLGDGISGGGFHCLTADRSQLLAAASLENQDRRSKEERQRRRCRGRIVPGRTQEACEVRDAHGNRVAGKARGESGRKHG